VSEEHPPSRPDATVVEILEHAELALQSGDPEAAMASCRLALELDERCDQAMFLMGEAYRDLGSVEGAMDSYRRCVLTAPRRADAWTALGTMQLFVLQLDESLRALNRALREDPSNPDAWYARGLLRERRENWEGADRDLARAARLDPSTYPFPVPLSDEELEQAVEEVLESLHPSLREYLANVAILVEEVPSDEILYQYDPPLSPGELLGYFSGHSLLERSMEDPWSHLPAAIVLFRRPLQRYAHTQEQLVRELRTTIYHEVGHFLGLDEDDLEARGLE
jgi:predicted Zn-dependent protease with MMP-like domain